MAGVVDKVREDLKTAPRRAKPDAGAAGSTASRFAEALSRTAQIVLGSTTDVSPDNQDHTVETGWSTDTDRIANQGDVEAPAVTRIVSGTIRPKRAENLTKRTRGNSSETRQRRAASSRDFMSPTPSSELIQGSPGSGRQSPVQKVVRVISPIAQERTVTKISMEVSETITTRRVDTGTENGAWSDGMDEPTFTGQVETGGDADITDMQYADYDPYNPPATARMNSPEPRSPATSTISVSNISIASRVYPDVSDGSVRGDGEASVGQVDHAQGDILDNDYNLSTLPSSPESNVTADGYETAGVTYGADRTKRADVGEASVGQVSDHQAHANTDSNNASRAPIPINEASVGQVVEADDAQAGFEMNDSFDRLHPADAVGTDGYEGLDYQTETISTDKASVGQVAGGGRAFQCIRWRGVRWTSRAR
jgi:hypothetical protein